MLGTSKHYKLSAIFSDTGEKRDLYYPDELCFKKDHIEIRGSMLDLTDPLVFYGLRLRNALNINSKKYGDFVPTPLEESAIYFDAVDKITLTRINGEEIVVFEKSA